MQIKTKNYSHKISSLSSSPLLFKRSRILINQESNFDTEAPLHQKRNYIKKSITYPEIASKKANQFQSIKAEFTSAISMYQLGVLSDKYLESLYFFVYHSQNLRELQIMTHFCITKFALLNLFDVISNQSKKSLEKLGITFKFSNFFKDDMMKIFSDKVMRSNTIRHFNVTFDSVSTLSPNGYEKFAESLKKMKNLQSFSFEVICGNKMDQSNFETFSRSLTHLLNLKKFKFKAIARSGLKKECLLELSKGILQLMKLESLDLSFQYWNPLDEFYGSILDTTSKLINLKELKLDYRSCTSKDENHLGSIAENLAKNKMIRTFHLTFDLNYKKYPNFTGIFNVFCKSVGTMTQLKDLSIEILDYPKDYTDTSNCLGEMMANLKNLESFQFYPFFIMLDETKPSIYESITKIHNLQILSTIKNESCDMLNTKILKIFGLSLAKMHRLKRLELFFGKIYDEIDELDERVIEDFFESVYSMAKLEILKFNLFYYSKERNFLNFSNKLKNLKELEMSIYAKSITDEFLNSLMISMQTLPKLENFRLSLENDQCITKKGLNILLNGLNCIFTLKKLSLKVRFCLEVDQSFVLDFEKFLRAMSIKIIEFDYSNTNVTTETNQILRQISQKIFYKNYYLD